MSEITLCPHPYQPVARPEDGVRNILYGGAIVRILVGVDGSDGARHALIWAADEAAARGCDVIAMLAYGFYGRPHQVQERFDLGASDSIAAAAEAVLAKAVESLPRWLAGVHIAREVCDREPVEGLLDRAGEEDMVVVGARGLGPIRRLLLGSIGAHCARHAHCPVIVVREGSASIAEAGGNGSPAARPVVVGVDGSPDSVEALRWAYEHARAHSLPLVAVQAWSLLPSQSPRLADVLTAAGQRDHDAAELRALVDGVVAPDAPGAPEVHVVDGQPAPVLLDAADGAELLVVGSRGRGGFARLMLGSTSATCVIHAPCSVAVLPSLSSRPSRHGGTDLVED